MKDEKRLEVDALLNSSAREIRFLKDFICKAPDVSRQHTWQIELMFNAVYTRLEQASAIVMKGVKV